MTCVEMVYGELRQTREHRNSLQQQLLDLRLEVAAVLKMMDGLAVQPGHEWNLRKCGDRLRAAIQTREGSPM